MLTNTNSHEWQKENAPGKRRLCMKILKDLMPSITQQNVVGSFSSGERSEARLCPVIHFILSLFRVHNGRAFEQPIGIQWGVWDVLKELSPVDSIDVCLIYTSLNELWPKLISLISEAKRPAKILTGFDNIVNLNQNSFQCMNTETRRP